MKRKVYCPVCKKWLFSVGEHTSGNVYIWCKQCRKEIRIMIKSH